MTHACVAYGRQIFSVGGRLAWYEDQNAGCYKAPALLYDAQLEKTVSEFDVCPFMIRACIDSR